MKLLAIISYYKPAYVYGGPVHSTANLYEGLARQGVDITVITTNANGNEKLKIPLFKPINDNGVQIIYCPTKYVPGYPFYSPQQIRLAKQLIPQVDIVNLQTFWGCATAPLSRYCSRHSVPYFVSLRGQLMNYALHQVSWYKQLKKKLFLHLVGYSYLNRAAALHATSPAEVHDLRFHPIQSPVFILPNSLDVHALQTLPARGRVRKQYGISEDALVMAMIGRLHPVKNPHIAVAALAAAQQLPNDVHLIFVGPDEYRSKSALIKQAEQNGCADKLHFTGLVQKKTLLSVLSDIDLLVMPSASENFGMSAAEGLAAGVPVLVSENVPVGYWAEKYGAGRVVAASPDAFIQATLEMLAMPKSLREEMGKHGRKLAREYFDDESIARQMLAQCQSIVDTGRPLS